MAFHTSTNDFGGESLRITPPSNLNETPVRFAELLTREHRAAYANPLRYFRMLAAECGIASMKAWLERLASAGACEIEINTSKWNTAVIVTVGGFQLSLREPVELPSSEASLHQLYSLILGTWHHGFPRAGGLHEPIAAADYGLTAIADDISDDAVVFFSTLSGDSLIAWGDNAYWFSHEVGLGPRAGAVAEVLSVYFEHVLRGTEVDFGFPY